MIIYYYCTTKINTIWHPYLPSKKNDLKKFKKKYYFAIIYGQEFGIAGWPPIIFKPKVDGLIAGTPQVPLFEGLFVVNDDIVFTVVVVVAVVVVDT